MFSLCVFIPSLNSLSHTHTQFDKSFSEFLAVDGHTTQQVNELMVGQEVVQQHPVVDFIFTLRQKTQHSFTTIIQLMKLLEVSMGEKL